MRHARLCSDIRPELKSESWTHRCSRGSGMDLNFNFCVRGTQVREYSLRSKNRSECITDGKTPLSSF